MALSDRAAGLDSDVEARDMDVAEWISAVTIDELSAEVRRHARRCLLDLIGVAAGGLVTVNARIVCDHAADHYGAGKWGARMLFDGRRVSVPGAAMAGAAAIDSLDAHDGHRLTKGHAGVVILPSLLAVCDELAACSGAEFLTRFVVGYEVAIRAGIALHDSVADYHTSGAWNAVGAAALVSRAIGLDREQIRHALGAAEYYGPRSQMMRCIDFPTMVKDGATYGAHAGVTSALLARDGFTGAPAVTVEDVMAGKTWNDLGTVWRITEQYLKPWPVCRWAQPAIQAALDVRAKISDRPIARIVLETFHEATRLSATDPKDTETAQYSLPFPLAAMLLHGTVDVDTITSLLHDPDITALAEKVELQVCPGLDAAFPAHRKARLTVVLNDGEVIDSDVVEAKGDPECPLTDQDVVSKFIDLAGPRIGAVQADGIVDTVDRIETIGSMQAFMDMILQPGTTD